MYGVRSKCFLVAVVLGFGSSCSMYKTLGQDGFLRHMTPIVKKQAAFDLQCSEAEIQVVQIGGVSLGASGCNRRASYVPEKTSCTPDTYEAHANDVCSAVIANVASKNP
jgi:hypothetical protein